MDLYYVSRRYDKNNDAGPKAKMDVEKKLSDFGFRIVEYNHYTSKLHKLILGLHDWYKELKRKDHSLIVLQYPLYSRISTKYFLFVAHRKHISTVALVHDIESLRQSPDDHKRINQEIQLLNKFTVVIAHNQVMKQWLIKQGLKVPIFVLGLFDYLSPVVPSRGSYVNVINFAGNLNKSGFLRKKFTNNELKVFGTQPEFQLNANMQYMGTFPPDDIVGQLVSGYGLVWDGPEIDTCSGSLGNYMRYNNPHKVSMYIRSGIPVIIWKNAALAPYIEKMKLGIAIASLKDLDKVLSGISKEEYDAFASNCYLLGKELQDGVSILACMNKVMKLLDIQTDLKG